MRDRRSKPSCPEELAHVAGGIELGEARKLIALVHRGETLPRRSPSEVRRTSLDRVRAATRRCRSCDSSARTPSAVDGFVKYALAGADGAVFEAVKIPLERPDRVTVCVSSQVGCALACSFCATGRLGLLRNLEAWEIVEQVRMVRRDLSGRHPRTRCRFSRHGRAARQLAGVRRRRA